jgi:hypothetical protein
LTTSDCNGELGEPMTSFGHAYIDIGIPCTSAR